MQNDQSGQSLVESIVIVPLFFVFLSGIIFVFYQQIRNETDENSFSVMKMSDAFFDAEEKKRNGWDTSFLSRNQSLSDIANRSLNASQAFSDAVDVKDKVFLDKKNVHDFSVKSDDANGFSFWTKADQKAYEKTAFLFKNNRDQMQTIEHDYQGESLYAPVRNFQWSQRAKEVATDVKAFQKTSKGQQFGRSYASLLPQKNNFVFSCLMEPFEPKCQLDPFAQKFNQIAQNRTNHQMQKCALEMTVSCLLLVEPPAIASCEARGIRSIFFATQSGKKVKECPFLNASAFVESQVSAAKALKAILTNQENEILKKNELYSN